MIVPLTAIIAFLQLTALAAPVPQQGGRFSRQRGRFRPRPRPRPQPSLIVTPAPITQTPAPQVGTASTVIPAVAVPFPTSAPEEFILPNPPREPPGPLFDATATRAATNARIRNAANPDICFDVSDFRTGDFRFNLIPIGLKKCDDSIAGQKFDLITEGEHNNVADGSRTIIVSTQQLTCVDRRGNINDRTRPGMFACGGRAAGDGETTADQQFFFSSTADLSAGIGLPLVQNSQNNGLGNGNQCLTFSADGFLTNAPCSPPNFTPEQTWFVEDGSNGGGAVPAPAPPPVVTQQPVVTTSSAASSVIPTSATPVVTSSPVTSPIVAPTQSAAPEEFILPNPPREAPGPLFDATAIRAATGAQIRNAANPDFCFDVSDFRSGDFRFNLVPLALKKCDRNVQGQKFDLITKGQHNNVQDGSRIIIVSSQQFTCVDRRGNINDRTRPGMFACGGRAAGDGETTADQQFFFSSTADLSAGIGLPLVQNSQNNGLGNGNQCLTFSADGFLTNAPCSPPNLTPEQTWFVEEL